ncbi:hypothetical protein PGT21_012045 [Puccinia graminis f. sp. tritici]|uniref:Uncharacterized protein n=1 Tax=Puccinia graminis f. sp. tritici TaxID=56615 RepID=A0A5B0P6S6_PUCGR|nr:hypothetical protein PGTUg99_008486 [Puccinia graminis f. sp. tritici]KAA1105571.1 hypothetical protein PGT21_012045 [Puccinia graminis f. sp. tritici]
MREIRRTSQRVFVATNSIVTGLNVQHDCHRGDCRLTETRAEEVERRKSSNLALELTHNDNERYIINLASLSSAINHRTFSDLPIKLLQPLDWINAMHNGIKTWGSTVEKKDKKADKKAQKKRSGPMASTSRTDPSLLPS